MSDINDKYRAYCTIRDLHGSPELAAALGNMLVAWSDAERSLQAVIHKATDMDQRLISDIFSQVPTFDGRKKLAKTLLDRWVHAGPEQEAVKTAIDQLSRLAKTRNDWVHGAWAEPMIAGTDLPKVIFDYREPHGSRKRRKPVKAVDILGHVRAVNQKALDIIELTAQLRPMKLKKT